MSASNEKPIVSIASESEEQLEANVNFNDRRDDLRKEVIARRAELPKPYRLHKSAAICDALTESLSLTRAVLGIEPGECIVAVYSAFEEEVQLDQFIRAAYDAGVRVAFPCMVEDAWGVMSLPQTMEMRLVAKEAYEAGTVEFLNRPLKKYLHNSEELAKYPYVPADELTMIVVPLVAFDANHNRLGYGGGNYDRYLPQLSAECRITGVAFSEQEVAAIPVEPHDIPLTVLAF